MNALTAEQIIRLWDNSDEEHPHDRALTCLAAALPDRTPHSLAELTIGQRDAYLLLLWEQTFGPHINSQATCPQCLEALEFGLNTQDIRCIDPAQPIANPVHAHQIDAWYVEFRLPNSHDWAAIDEADLGTFLQRQQLLERCVLRLSYKGEVAEIADLTPAIVNQIGAQISNADPQAEIRVDLNCPACNHAWQVRFDTSDRFWEELSACAQRLLQEVHQIALAYHWSERDILALSNARRQFYLNLLTSNTGPRSANNPHFSPE